MINCLQFLGASAALASERARLRDRLIRMEYLAAETNLGPEDKEKFIRRRMNKAYCRWAKKTKINSHAVFAFIKGDSD